jgi:hypothetical protein
MGNSPTLSRSDAFGQRRRVSRAAKSSDRGERGASLILALIFIVVVAVLVGAVSDMAINDLSNTTHFNSATALDYSASGVADLAIQSVRYAPIPNGSLVPCWGSSGLSEETINTGTTVAIWCDSASHAGSSQSRVVTMYACNNNPGQNATASSCQANPLLTLVEAYDDYSATGTDTCTTNPGPATCGFGASTLVWTWGSLASAVGGLILNTITITSPVPTGSNAAPGAMYEPTATTASGDPVTITSGSPTTCTVASGVVTFIGAANTICTVNFDDPGNFNYAPATEQSQQVTIS